MATGDRDIFGYVRSPKPTSTFSSDDSILTFGQVGQEGGNLNAVGLMIQGWNVNYQQQIQEVFELGSHNIYWVKGRPQGGGGINRVVGPSAAGNSIKLFPDAAYDPCSGGVSTTLSVGGKVCGVQSDNKSSDVEYTARIKLDGLLVLSIGFNANVSDTRIMEGLNFRFTYMDVSED